jgi:hypothetical protein
MDGFLEKDSPMRSPRWRYDRVLKVLRTPGLRLPELADDHPIRACHRYLVLGAAAQTSPEEFAEFCQDYPHVEPAVSLHYSPAPELQYILQARLLTAESLAQIAARLGTDELVIRFYSDLFFDVRDRLEARDWIMKVILGPPELRAKFNKDGTLTDAQRGFLYRLFAYYGGPLVLDALIAGIGGLNRLTRGRTLSGGWTTPLEKSSVRGPSWRREFSRSPIRTQ